MTNEEAIKELEWIRERGFVADKGIIGTDRIVESVSIAIKAIEKQTPKKPVIGIKKVWAFKEDWYKDFRCPVCGANLYEEDYEGYSMTLLQVCVCGQFIDWSEVI